MTRRLLLLAVCSVFAACGGAGGSASGGGSAASGGGTSSSGGGTSSSGGGTSSSGGGTSSSGGGTSSSGGGTSSSGGGTSSSGGGSADAGEQMEAEPNNGVTLSQVNAFTIPGAMTGIIDPADDIDILTVQLNAGDFWAWHVEPSDAGTSLAAHLGIGEAANKVPSLVARAAAGGSATQEQFALSSGTYFVFLRDLRNVGAPSQHVGGPAFGWRLTAEKQNRTPTPLTLPANLNGTLSSRTAQAVYAFTTSASSMVTIDVRCQNKQPTSDMDPRLSLFDANAKKWLQTNDDRTLGSNVDSLLQGTLPAGSYVIVIDNVSSTNNDLTFQLLVTST